MSEPAPTESGRSPWPRPVRELVGGMTLQEKAAQVSSTVLTAVDGAPPVPGIGIVYLPTALPDGPAQLAAFRAATDARIPVLPLALGPDLDRPFLPPLGRIATWDLRLAEQMAAATARAQRAVGVYGQLVPAGSTAPGADSPTALDPVLTGAFAEARVLGAQGRAAGWAGPIGPDHVAVLAPLGVWPDGQWHERVLRGRLLAPAEAAVHAGAAAIVPSPAGNAGVPTHTDVWLLRQVLRREWRFGGAVLAHPGAVDALDTTYRIASGPDQAVALALEAGVDVVGAGSRVDHLVALVQSGAVAPWLVDDAVAAVLSLKFRPGLLDSHPPAHHGAPAARTSPAHVERAALTRSTVLLTDPGGVLPLDRARAVEVLPGAVDSADVDALARALAAVLPGVAVWPGPAVTTVAPGSPADAVVVTARPEDAVRTAETAVAAGRRCVVVVTGDEIGGLAALAATTATVLLCWRPLGDHAGVLADVLAGHAEPGGRLPVAVASAFPLGHGGGYTTFDYSRLVISPPVLDGGDVLRVRCSVTNTGSRPGREVVQVYLANPTGRTVVADGTTLAAFAAVDLEPGQTLPVTVRLPPARLAVWNRTMRHIVEPGTVDVLVGRSAADIRLRGTVTVAAHPAYWRR